MFRDQSDSEALARLAAEVRKNTEEAVKGDADSSAVDIGSALNALERAGYGYGDDFAMVIRGEERVEGSKHRGAMPRSATPGGSVCVCARACVRVCFAEALSLSLARARSVSLSPRAPTADDPWSTYKYTYKFAYSKFTYK